MCGMPLRLSSSLTSYARPECCSATTTTSRRLPGSARDHSSRNSAIVRRKNSSPSPRLEHVIADIAARHATENPLRRLRREPTRPRRPEAPAGHSDAGSWPWRRSWTAHRRRSSRRPGRPLPARCDDPRLAECAGHPPATVHPEPDSRLRTREKLRFDPTELAKVGVDRQQQRPITAPVPARHDTRLGMAAAPRSTRTRERYRDRAWSSRGAPG